MCRAPGRLPRRPDRRRPRRPRGAEGRRRHPGVQRRLPRPTAAADRDRGDGRDRGAAGAPRRCRRRRPARSWTGRWPSSRPPRPGRPWSPRSIPGTEQPARARPRCATTSSGAVREGRQVRLTYWVPSRDEETERVVDPRRMVSSGGATYLDAWCHSAEDDRLFRLDRIHAATVLDDPGHPRGGRLRTRPGATVRLRRRRRAGDPGCSTRRRAGWSSTTRSRRRASCPTAGSRSTCSSPTGAGSPGCCCAWRPTPGCSRPRSVTRSSSHGHRRLSVCTRWARTVERDRSQTESRCEGHLMHAIVRLAGWLGTHPDRSRHPAPVRRQEAPRARSRQRPRAAHLQGRDQGPDRRRRRARQHQDAGAAGDRGAQRAQPSRRWSLTTR